MHTKTRHLSPAAVALAAACALVPAHAAAADPAADPGELAAAVCSGRLSSVALVGEAIARAKAAAPYNAFVHIDEAGALAAARAADAAAAATKGRRCKPLLGVPIVVKDNVHVAGMPATAGTPALKDFVPLADAPVVARLRAAGAVPIGKTHMHELAFGISGFNPAYTSGPEPGVRNAYDRTRSAGGSSAGTGAALGLRVVGAGLGTDTGGSVRIPCAFNGCAALRPTVGRYPGAAILPIARTRDTAGPMALSVEGLELLDRVIAGGTPARPADAKRIRLGVVPELLADLDADTRSAFDDARRKLEAAGVSFVDVAMPRLFELNGAVGFPVALYEAYDDVVAYLARHRPETTIAQLAAAIASPDVKGTYEGFVIPRKLPGPNNTAADAKPAYEAAMKTARPQLQRLYSTTFRTHRLDGLVFPTVPRVAMPATPESSSVPVFLSVIRNTDPGSNAGLPGVQVPIALGASTKLPVGLEIDGPAGSDRRLLAIALTVQSVLGRLPPPAR